LSFNPPEVDKSASPPQIRRTRRTADKGLISLRLINSPPLGAIMDIPIDIPLLCGGVVHFVLVIKGNEFF